MAQIQTRPKWKEAKRKENKKPRTNPLSTYSLFFVPKSCLKTQTRTEKEKSMPVMIDAERELPGSWKYETWKSTNREEVIILEKSLSHHFFFVIFLNTPFCFLFVRRLKLGCFTLDGRNWTIGEIPLWFWPELEWHGISNLGVCVHMCIWDK